MNVQALTLFCLAGGFAGVSAGGIAVSVSERRLHTSRRRLALGLEGGALRKSRSIRDARGFALRYAESLTRKLYTGATEPLSLAVRTRATGRTRTGKRFVESALPAGCDKDVSVQAFCETCARFGLAGCLLGALLGSVLSIELGIVLGCAGLLAGRALPVRALGDARRRRAIDADKHLSEMLEVVALGLRSGLSFDLSFALYGSHFDGEFAGECAKAYRRWALGLVTRDESLARFARSYDSDQLKRVIEGIVRSLKLGTSLVGVLEDAASQARLSYHSALEERVAKAPVKMMLPTGTLILPAMLLLVIGPVLLELAGGF